MYSPKRIINDFPYINRLSHGNKQLVYLDNAATTHKPQSVVDAMVRFYTQENAPVHRSIYGSSEHVTSHYELARATVAHFISAQTDEIVFTAGATSGINMIARGWGDTTLQAGDEIIISILEHHANFVPWQECARRVGALLRIIPLKSDGSLDMTVYDQLINERTRLVAITQCSNVLGTQPDLSAIVAGARRVGARVLVDAAQSIAHQVIDVKLLDIDFLVFSGHKIYGPTGIGVLYINQRVHHEVAPINFGGGMVFSVEQERSMWIKPPHCFEAGTPPITQVIGLAQALTYVREHINAAEFTIYEAQLCTQVIDRLSSIQGITVLGPLEELKKNGHLVSFVVDGIHAHDVAAYLDYKGIAVRAGHHCAQPLHKALGVDASVRVSFAAYTTQHDIDVFLNAMDHMYESI
jgi:cysteine desulfurase / selenocysteine lyase